MKRVINWTFGSVFRTFGRVIAYIAIGALFALIMSKNNIKITDLLGIERVDALTTITPSTYGHKVEFSTGRCSFGTFPNCDYIVEGTTQSGWLTGDYTNFCSSSNPSIKIPSISSTGIKTTR